MKRVVINNNAVKYISKTIKLCTMETYQASNYVRITDKIYYRMNDIDNAISKWLIGLKYDSLNTDLNNNLVYHYYTQNKYKLSYNHHLIIYGQMVI